MASLTSISGELLAIDELGGRRGAGVHASLEVGGDVREVHIAPAWYLEQQGVRLSRGDLVNVTGWSAVIAGKPVLIAQRVARGVEVLALRDTEGAPAWARPPGGTIESARTTPEPEVDEFLQQVWTAP
jgi:hypothetical protein